MTLYLRRRTGLAFLAVLAVVALTASDCGCFEPDDTKWKISAPTVVAR